MTWLHAPADDGHHGVPADMKVPVFGQAAAKFPLALFIDSIDSIHDLLLPETLSCDRADGSTFCLLSSPTAKQYRSTWRKRMNPTIDMVLECIDGRLDWGEPQRLGPLGATVRFVPRNRNGILSLFPPHNPHPLPLCIITRFTFIPVNRIIQSGHPEHTEQEPGIYPHAIQDPLNETVHLRFSMSPPGMYTQVLPNLPIDSYIWNNVGFTLWLLYPPTKSNMEVWYSDAEYNSSQTILWAMNHLKGLKVSVASPGQRIIIPKAYFYASLSLTPTIQSALELMTHHDLPQVLRLRLDRLSYMEHIRTGHGISNITDELYSWTEGLDQRFLKPFRTRWSKQWDVTIQQLNADLKAKEDYEEGDVEMHSILDDSEF